MKFNPLTIINNICASFLRMLCLRFLLLLIVQFCMVPLIYGSTQICSDEVLNGILQTHSKEFEKVSKKLDNVLQKFDRLKTPALSVNFDGAGSEIAFGTTSELHLQLHSFSILVWVNINHFHYENSIVACKESHFLHENQCLHFTIRNSRVYFGFYWNDVGSVDGTIPPSTWFHLAISYNAQSQVGRIFVNGELKKEKHQVRPLNGNHPLFVSRYAPEGHGLDGRVSELRFFPRALDNAEIKSWMFNRTESIASIETSPDKWKDLTPPHLNQLAFVDYSLPRL